MFTDVLRITIKLSDSQELRPFCQEEHSRNCVPSTLYTPNLSLDTKFPFSPDFTSYSSDFSREDGQLTDHAVDGVDKIQHLSGYGYTLDLLR